MSGNGSVIFTVIVPNPKGLLYVGILLSWGELEFKCLGPSCSKPNIFIHSGESRGRAQGPRPPTCGQKYLRTFAPIVSAHPYCARIHVTRACHVMHPAHSLRMELDKYSAGGRFNNWARILLSWMHGDPCLSFHRSLPLLILSIVTKKSDREKF